MIEVSNLNFETHTFCSNVNKVDEIILKFVEFAPIHVRDIKIFRTNSVQDVEVMVCVMILFEFSEEEQ